MTVLSGSARADTPFGPLAGRTPVMVTDQGADSAVIQFHCGSTPVMLAVSGPNFLGLIRGLIALAADDTRAALESELEAALSVVAA
jgi:hypothetical protein